MNDDRRDNTYIHILLLMIRCFQNAIRNDKGTPKEYYFYSSMMYYYFSMRTLLYQLVQTPWLRGAPNTKRTTPIRPHKYIHVDGLGPQEGSYFHSYCTPIIESVHKPMGQIMRTIMDQARPITMDELDTAVDEALTMPMRACRCASNTSLQGIAPGANIFGREMHLNIPIVSDIISISENRQLQTDLRLQRKNA